MEEKKKSEAHPRLCAYSTDQTGNILRSGHTTRCSELQHQEADWKGQPTEHSTLPTPAPLNSMIVLATILLWRQALVWHPSTSCGIKQPSFPSPSRCSAQPGLSFWEYKTSTTSTVPEYVASARYLASFVDTVGRD